jgi:branched-chain amino acid aminotransferase
MKKISKIWMDGKLVPWEKANIHVLTHTLHYGGGAFEGIRFYDTDKGPAIFRMKEHMDRLFYSANKLALKTPYSKKQLTDASKKLIKISKLKSGYIRPLIYYGYGKMGLDPRGCPVKTMIAVWPWGAYLGTEPVNCKISNFIRIHPKSTYSEAKLCGHYVNSILASLEIHSKGYDEALLLDYKGNLAEGPGENVFIVKNGKLITPPRGNILAGITRNSIFEIAKNEGIPSKEAIISQKMLFSADEAFYTGTMGPVTKHLKQIFTKTIHGKLPKYKKWLTIVN